MMETTQNSLLFNRKLGKNKIWVGECLRRKFAVPNTSEKSRGKRTEICLLHFDQTEIIGDLSLSSLSDMVGVNTAWCSRWPRGT